MRLLLLIGLIAAGIYAYSLINVPGEDTKPPRNIVDVRSHNVTLSSYEDRLHDIGTARSLEAVDIVAQASEPVKHIAFAQGAVVNKGTLLVTLRQAQQQSVLTAARTRLEEAKRVYQRAKQLQGRDFASKATLDEAATALANARQELAAANAQIQDRTITAPFDGILGTRTVSIGALVNPGDIITTIDDISAIRVDMDIAERYVPLIAVGDAFSAMAEAYPNRTFDGKITVIERRIDPVARTLRLEGLIPNPDQVLRPGMLLDITLNTGEEQIILVPEQSIIPIARQHYVFVIVEDARVERRLVTLGRFAEGRVEITSGLKPGEHIVTEGQLKLRDAMEVHILDAKEEHHAR